MKEYYYGYQKRLRDLRGKLMSYGITNGDVSKWLRCTPQNVSNHWNRGSFSAYQLHVISERLREIEEEFEAHHHT